MTGRGLEALAAEVGARDVFVFHVLSDERMVNLDGWGRGSGWAGNICLDPETEPFLAAAIENGSASIGPGSPARIFGPYWAEEAVAVRLDGHVVALGGQGVASLPAETLSRAAHRAVDEVSELGPKKQLADKLELAQAELSVATIEASSLGEAAVMLASAAAKALSCEFGAVLLIGEAAEVYLADEGWRPTATRDEVITALTPLIPPAREGLVVEQDLRHSPYAVPPLGFGDGLVSRCTTAFQVGARAGLLTVAHSGSAPRGFTDLCRSVITAMAAVAPLPLSRHD
jgi:hypothetical protein